jgi:hypothetical protein
MTEYRAHNASEDTHDIPPRRCYEEILLLSTIVRETPRALLRELKSREASLGSNFTSEAPGAVADVRF